MRDLIIGVVLTILSFGMGSSIAGEQERRSAEETAGAKAPMPLFGMPTERVTVGQTLSSFCSMETTRRIPSSAVVVVLKATTCTSRYMPSKDYFEILYAGERYYIAATDLELPPETSKGLAELTDEQREAYLPSWKRDSGQLHAVVLRRAFDALNATSKRGVAVLKSSVFDTSEYTEGTGFDVSVYNSGSKTIKYITFSVVGYNAVKDPVKDRRKGTSTQTLRGIGPIEPESTASYSEDYMWMTDIVETHRLVGIKLEYMDGTVRNIQDPASVTVSRQVYEVFEPD